MPQNAYKCLIYCTLVTFKVTRKVTKVITILKLACRSGLRPPSLCIARFCRYYEETWLARTSLRRC